MSEDQIHEFVGQPIRNKSYFSSNCVSKSSMTSPWNQNSWRQIMSTLGFCLDIRSIMARNLGMYRLGLLLSLRSHQPLKCYKTNNYTLNIIIAVSIICIILSSWCPIFQELCDKWIFVPLSLFMTEFHFLTMITH